MRTVAWLCCANVAATVPDEVVVMRTFVPALSREIRLCPTAMSRLTSFARVSLTAVDAWPMSSRCPPARVTGRELSRTLLAVPVLSRVSRVSGMSPAIVPPLRVTVPELPRVPAPLTTTAPRLTVVGPKVLAAVSVRVLAPTLVRVRALVSEFVMTPERVISPEVTPDSVLIRVPPMLVLPVSEMAPAKVDAVEELLSNAACELTSPRPDSVPVPPKPEPVILRGSAPTLKPLRSRTAPEATVVPLVVSLRAAALPSLRIPRLTVSVVKVLPEPERINWLVPVFVKAKAPVILPLSVMSPAPPMDEALPSVRLPESVTAVGLLFQTAPVKLAAS